MMKINILGKIDFKFLEDRHFAELVKGFGTAFILRITGIVEGYLFTLLVTKTLGAEAWGTFALSLAVLQIATVIGRLGIDTALLKFTAEYVAKGEIGNLRTVYKKSLFLVLLFSSFVAIVVYFLSPILAAEIFHEKNLANHFRIISFAIVPAVLLWIHSGCIRGLKKIKQYMLLQQTGVFGISFVLFALCLTIGKKQTSPVIIYSLAIFTLSIISFCLWRKYLLTLFISSGSYRLNQLTGYAVRYSKILSISVPMLLSNSLFLIMSWIDTIILGAFENTQEVGIYNVALRLSMITSVTLVAINSIAAPKFAEFWGNRDIEGLARVAQQSTKLIFWVSFPILLLFLIFPECILGLFGEEFKMGAFALVILAMGQFINAVSGSVGYILQMTDKQKVFRNVVLFAVIVNILLCFSLIPAFGILGAAIANSVTIVFINVVSLFLIRYYYGFYTICGLFSG